MGNPRLRTAFILGDEFDAAAFVAPFRKAGWRVRRGRTTVGTCRVLDTPGGEFLGAGIAAIERPGPPRRSLEYWLVPRDGGPARLVMSRPAGKKSSLSPEDEAVLDGGALQPIAEFASETTRIDFSSAKERFTARLVINRSGPRRSFAFLEFEIRRGGPAALTRVASVAQHEKGIGAERSGFVEETLGLLHLKAGPKVLPHPVLEASMEAGDAALRVLGCAFENMLAQEAGARMGLDPEYVHDMRVAIRRMRASLRMFSRVFVKEDRAKISSELRWLAGVLGRVRDLDVYMTAVPRYLALIGAQTSDYDFYMRELAARRSTGRAELVIALDGERYERFKADVRAFLQKPRLAGQGPSLCDVAAASIGRFSAEVFGAGGRVEDEDTLHAMRLSFKRLRYAVEFLGGLSPRRLRRVARIASRFQDVLGRFNDATVACSQVKRGIGQGRRDDMEVFLLGYLYACQRLAAIEAKRAFLKRWRSRGAKRLKQALKSARQKL